MSIINSIKHWTPFVFLYPNGYIKNSPTFKNLNLHEWSKERYEYDADDWNGFKDVAQNPYTTIRIDNGDCEDYALVAASWAISNNRNPSLVFLWNEGFWPPYPSHVVMVDGDSVYSSGRIYENTSLDEYVDNSKYGRYIKREIT